jgi:hypothetical protein
LIESSQLDREGSRVEDQQTETVQSGEDLLEKLLEMNNLDELEDAELDAEMLAQVWRQLNP